MSSSVDSSPLGVDTAKDLLFARLRVSEEGPGYIHFSDTLGEEYSLRQLTAEKVVIRYVRGYKNGYTKRSEAGTRLSIALFTQWGRML